jgi:hypothetical protein
VDPKRFGRRVDEGDAGHDVDLGAQADGSTGLRGVMGLEGYRRMGRRRRSYSMRDALFRRSTISVRRRGSSEPTTRPCISDETAG